MKTGWIRHIPHNPRLRGLARRIPDVVFSTATGTELKMQILCPWEAEQKARRFPLIVFLQGSGWTFPDVDYELPQLAAYARAGYVVATITHRNSQDGHPAPAFLQDAKTAIRFLRANAAEYAIDPERVCFFGTSSGGNTSMLVAMTGDDPRYQTQEYAGFSDAVQLAVECFGPADLEPLARERGDDDAMAPIAGNGTPEERMALLRSISPLHVFQEKQSCAPLLMIHGDADDIVPYEDGVAMYRALCGAGMDAEMICVDGAPHEGSFWSQELHEAILDFIGRRL